jgi:hypothetical protein
VRRETTRFDQERERYQQGCNRVGPPRSEKELMASAESETAATAAEAPLRIRLPGGVRLWRTWATRSSPSREQGKEDQRGNCRRDADYRRFGMQADAQRLHGLDRDMESDAKHRGR